MSGVTKSATNAVTTAPNAAPMTTATARSTTFPRSTKSRNSLSILCPPLGRTSVEALDGQECQAIGRPPFHARPYRHVAAAVDVPAGHGTGRPLPARGHHDVAGPRGRSGESRLGREWRYWW